jgi:tRNA A37 methylthiotransferase MiaB
MNRKYTYSHYANLIKLLRENIKDISITTDIIVGFPSETQEDFEMTFSAVKEIAFDGLYVFRYSPRPGALSQDFPDDITKEEKQRRLALILELGNKISADIVSAMVGTKQEVLIEAMGPLSLEGRTNSGRKVFIKGDESLLGQLRQVKIVDAKVNSLFGEII